MAQGVPSSPNLPGPEEGKDLGNWPRGGAVQPSAEKEQGSGSRRWANPHLAHLGTTGPPQAGLPGTKYLARGGALFTALPTRGQGSGSVLSLEGGMIFAPRRFSSLLHLTPPLLCGPGSSRDPNCPRIANEEVRQMPLISPPLPRLSPYRAPGLASNRCSLSVALMRPRSPRAAWGSRARTPVEMNRRSCAPGALGCALSCGVSPSCRSRRPACAPRPPALPRACSGPGCAGAAVRPSRRLAAPAPALRAERSLLSVPRVLPLYLAFATPCEAVRRASCAKARGEGGGVTGCKDAPELPSSTGPLRPWGSGNPPTL